MITTDPGRAGVTRNAADDPDAFGIPKERDAQPASDLQMPAAHAICPSRRVRRTRASLRPDGDLSAFFHPFLICL